MPRIHSTAVVINVFTPILRALQVGRLGDAFAGVDEHEAVTEAAMQEHRDGAERPVIVTRREIGRSGHLGHVEFAVVEEAPMSRRRIHVSQDGEIDAVDRDLAVDQRADDLVIAAGQGEG